MNCSTDNHAQVWFTENLRVNTEIERILEEVPVNATINNQGHQHTQRET